VRALVLSAPIALAAALAVAARINGRRLRLEIPD
jgi:hypothetical protein